MDERKIAALDTRLVKAARHVHVLNALAWPAGSDEKFLSGWRKGKPALPDCTPVKKDLGENITELEAIAGQCREEDPVEKFLYETAQSYAHAARMLGATGTPDFTHHSARLYGRPDQLYKLQGMTVLDAARFFLDLTDDLLGTGYIPAMNFNISASQFAAWMQPKVDDFFGAGTISVEQDPQLSAKAIAGASRIRVRSTAMFSKLDQEQLLNHEAFVHAATMLNGKRQVKLQSLALGAPRTTRTQEGIAVLSELFTNTMDIARLRRVALRVIAVQQALDGADFIDVFKSFLEAGQSEDESVRSTQRVFRGGAVKDGIVFTKDAVYLSGLFEVHTFMRIAIRDNRPELIGYMFAGRLTLADALRLAPLFDSGWLSPPQYVPDWASDLNRISAYMAYSAFISNIRLDRCSLSRIMEFEDDLKALG